MPSLLHTLAAWRSFDVLVVGDFMLDQLVFGDAERLTADAPVPVLHVRRTEERAGGAASVCADLAALGARVHAVGVTGDDADADLLAERLAATGADASGLVRDAQRPTTVKRSLIGLAQHRHPQKMFRLDHESRDPVAENVRDALLAHVDERLAAADVVAIEDYGKGVCDAPLCRAVIERCGARGIPVLVDPAARSSFDLYAGCTAITPNRTEAERATAASAPASPEHDRPERMARALAAQLDAEAVVITLDRHGALLLERGGEPTTIPTVARQVYDVTGAGDMVLAALCAAVANGLAWPDAVRLANVAAGLEVEVFGTQPIPFERVYAAVLNAERSRHDKHRSAEEAAVEVAAARRDGKRVVFTNGCFDILHAGHIALLREAARFGDLLVVAVNADESVARLKGPDRPVHAQHDRVNVLSELESVAIVVVFHEDTPEPLLRRLRPDVLVKGGDYTKDEVVGAAFVESYGGRVEIVPLLAGRSTTTAIEKIRSS